MQKIEKFKNIELLRFLFTIAIVYFHIVKLRTLYLNFDIYENLRKLAINADLSVDCFFIMAGFFLFYTFDINKYSVINFIKKRIIRLVPVIIFATLCVWLLSLINFVEYTTYYNLFTLGLINCIGITLKKGNNLQTWFVSVLFWVSLLYTYFFKCFSKEKINLIIASLIIFSYSFLLHAYNGSIEGYQKNFYYFINTGVLRGLAGIGLGYFISMLYKNISIKTTSIKNKLIYTFFEIYLFVFVFNNMLFHNLSYKNDLVIIFAFAALFILFLIKQGYFSRLLEKDIFVKLGKYSYSTFIMQFIIIYSFNHLIFKKNAVFYNSSLISSHPFLVIISMLLASLLVGILTYHLIEKPCAKYLTQKFFPQPQTLAAVGKEKE